jgi:hypothetical protein
MPIYNVNVDVESARGSQTYEIIADSPEEAHAEYNSGGGEFVCEEVEVTSLSKPEVSEFYVVEESNLPPPAVSTPPSVQTSVYVVFRCPVCGSHTSATLPELTYDVEECIGSEVSVFCSNDKCMAEYKFGPA